MKSLARTLREPMHLCCSEHTIVIFYQGAFWWRRHEWNANQWAPLGLPGSADEVEYIPPPAAKRRTPGKHSRRKTPVSPSKP